MNKRMTALLMTAALLLASTAALAVNTTDIYGVKDFKFHHYSYGIGYGGCPVYTAPSKNAYRVGNATCSTNSDMYIAGVGYGGWLLVRYETNNGGVRVGYIPPEYIQGFRFDKLNYVEEINRSRVPCVAQANIPITDNPLSSYSSFGTIYAGQTYYILATYTYYGNWWYVECTVNGQPARGFIDRNWTVISQGNGGGSQGNANPYYPSNPSGGSASADPRYPAVSPLGTPQLGTVTIMADGTMVRQNADPNTQMVGRVNNYEVYPYYECKTGTTGNPWYYIYIYSQNAWGWVAGGRLRVN